MNISNDIFICIYYLNAPREFDMKKSLRVKAYESMRNKIVSFRIKPGEKIFEKDEMKSVRSDLKRSVIINKKMVAQICPECGHDELYLEGGLIAGHIYHCKKCDYVGAFVLEREIDLKNVK